jgi:hypothetical protein
VVSGLFCHCARFCAYPTSLLINHRVFCVGKVTDNICLIVGFKSGERIFQVFWCGMHVALTHSNAGMTSNFLNCKGIRIYYPETSETGMTKIIEPEPRNCILRFLALRIRFIQLLYGAVASRTDTKAAKAVIGTD